jgi:hypothetical protein
MLSVKTDNLRRNVVGRHPIRLGRAALWEHIMVETGSEFTLSTTFGDGNTRQARTKH